jgi:hypothetical protein
VKNDGVNALMEMDLGLDGLTVMLLQKPRTVGGFGG